MTLAIGLGVSLLFWIGAPAASATFHGAGEMGLVPMASSNATSTLIAGYLVEPVAASASASDTFTVPTLTCTSTTSGAAVGSVVVGTTSQSAANVFLTCTSGVPAYYGALELNNSQTFTTFTPKAGDVIDVSVTESTTAAKVTLKDVTQAKSSSLSGTGTTNAEAFDGMNPLEYEGAQVPVVNFGKEAISKAKVDGKTLVADHASAVDMETSTHVLQIFTGKLNTAGTGFTERFRHA